LLHTPEGSRQGSGSDPQSLSDPSVTEAAQTDRDYEYLIGATISLESEVGAGTTFTLT
jgi:hypothetical protein